MNPHVLEFTKDLRKVEYEITFASLLEPGSFTKTMYSSGSLSWSDGMHNVTNPINITFEVEEAAAAM